MNTQSTTPIQNKRSLENSLRILEVFRGMNKDTTVGEICAFLHIAIGEKPDSGISVTEVSNLLEAPLSTTSRYVQSLGDVDRNRNPGLKLISDQIDPMERRKKILRLTPSGKQVVAHINLILGE